MHTTWQISTQTRVICARNRHSSSLTHYADAATRFRASAFHPTRTGTSNNASNSAVPLTFKTIFGRHTLLKGETGEFEDLTPLNNTGLSINQASVRWNESYTNGKYTIDDPHNLKQRVKKSKDVSSSPDTPSSPPASATPPGGNPPPASQPGVGTPPQTQGRRHLLGTTREANTEWFVYVVSMKAKITSLKVIWKHVSHPFSHLFPLLPSDLSTPCPFLSARSNPERSQAGIRANPAGAAGVSQRQLDIPT